MDEKINFIKKKERRLSKKTLFIIIYLIAFGFVAYFTFFEFNSSKKKQLTEKIQIESMRGVLLHHVMAIETFDSKKKLLKKCSGFFIDHEMIITNRNAFTDAESCTINLFNQVRLQSFQCRGENINKDFIFIPISYKLDYSYKIYLERGKQDKGKIFLINPYLDFQDAIIKGEITGTEVIDPFGEVSILSCEFPEEMAGAPVFLERGTIIGIANIVKNNAGELKFFFVGCDFFSGQLSKKAYPLTEKNKGISNTYLRKNLTPFEQGLFLFEKEAFGQAEGYFYEHLQLNPKDTDGWFYYGNTLKMNHKPEEALDALNKVLEANPDNNKARKIKLSILREQKMNFIIKSELEKAVAVDPGDTEMVAELGAEYIEGGEFDSAFQLLERSIHQLGLKDSRLFVQLGIAALRRDDKLKAYRSFFEALEMDPGCLNCYIEFGRYFIAVRQWSKGIEIFKSGAAILRSSPEIHCLLAFMYFANEDMESAKDIIDRFSQLNGERKLMFFKPLSREISRYEDYYQEKPVKQRLARMDLLKLFDELINNFNYIRKYNKDS